MPEPTEISAVAPIIIIRKKKVIHGGHHGGAWKVAYADFVTALMALFIVLWLVSAASKEVKSAVGGYFRDPTGTGKDVGTTRSGVGEALAVTKDDMVELKEKLEKAIQQTPHFREIKGNLEMSVTGEGLRIELLETEKGMFFEIGRPNPSESGRELLALLAAEIGTMPNRILIEGHTDAKPYDGSGYSNWELSADRANAARKLMQSSGMRADQVAQVRGFADQTLRDPKDPEAPTNRRVSVIVKYLDESPSAPGKPGGAKHGEAKQEPAKPAGTHGPAAGHK